MKVLVATSGDDVAARFDLTQEVAMVHLESGVLLGEPRMLLLPRCSGEDLCALAIKEQVSVAICGGIEDVHHEYLGWKSIRVIDSVIGPWAEALRLFSEDGLLPGTILSGARKRGGD